MVSIKINVTSYLREKTFRESCYKHPGIPNNKEPKFIIPDNNNNFFVKKKKNVMNI